MAAIRRCRGTGLDLSHRFPPAEYANVFRVEFVCTCVYVRVEVTVGVIRLSRT